MHVYIFTHIYYIYILTFIFCWHAVVAKYAGRRYVRTRRHEAVGSDSDEDALWHLAGRVTQLCVSASSPVVCCSVLQCVVVCCAAVCCSVLQCVTQLCVSASSPVVCCSVLQCAAV